MGLALYNLELMGLGVSSPSPSIFRDALEKTLDTALGTFVKHSSTVPSFSQLLFAHGIPSK